jgi:hypothetical protein
MDGKLSMAIREQVGEGALSCADAFRIAGELGVTPQAIRKAADALGVRLARCQLGLFGYGDRKSIVEPAGEVGAELEQALKEGLILGRLPCAVAWAIAGRFGMSKLEVANSAEALGVRVSQCQLGAF